MLYEVITVVDTDLGERIVQFRNEPPSHIVLPAIHLKKEDVAKTFHEKINTDENNSDPTYLTRAAREHLREKFLNARITSYNVCYTKLLRFYSSFFCKFKDKFSLKYCIISIKLDKF